MKCENENLKYGLKNIQAMILDILKVKRLQWILLCAFIFHNTNNAISQDPVSASANVTTATNTGIMVGSMSSLVTIAEEASRYQEKLVDLHERAEKMKENYKFLKDIESYARLAKLLEKAICNTQNFQLNIRLANSSCIDLFNIELLNFQFGFSLDMLYLVFEAGLSMTQAERIRTLNDAITVLENNQSKIAQFNTMINSALTAQNMKKYTQKSLNSGYTLRR
ncbi:MAG: hypothetical protein ACK4K9_10115 [Bacteroidia bacterium]